jgi:hypothetical protein
VRWKIDRHAHLQAEYGIFYAGEFPQASLAGAQYQVRGIVRRIQILK